MRCACFTMYLDVFRLRIEEFLKHCRLVRTRNHPLHLQTNNWEGLVTTFRQVPYPLSDCDIAQGSLIKSNILFLCGFAAYSGTSLSFLFSSYSFLFCFEGCTPSPSSGVSTLAVVPVVSHDCLKHGWQCQTPHMSYNTGEHDQCTVDYINIFRAAIVEETLASLLLVL
jgi:hypothetical protein